MMRANIAIPPLVTALLCLCGAVAAVLSERRGWKLGQAVFKVAASTAFVILALECGAAASIYGQLILTALILCWLGDVFLLSRRKIYFLLGTVSFLIAHIAFGAAFASLSLNWPAFWIGMTILAASGIGMLSWLWVRLSGIFKIAVPAYIAAILTMTSLAIAHSAASGSLFTAAGALAFTASDISVARDRFFGRETANYAWGLPLYYLAVVLLATSAGPVAS